MVLSSCNMPEKQEGIPLEEYLLRSGDILNTMGLLRSALLCKGIIEFEKYLELIKKNYLIKTPEIPTDLANEAKMIWKDSICIFRDLQILKKSTEKQIEIFDPRELFFSSE